MCAHPLLDEAQPRPLNGDRPSRAWCASWGLKDGSRRRRVLLGLAAVFALVIGATVVRRLSGRHKPFPDPFPEPGAGPEELVRGVSLGGWLVIEAFITPGIFRRANDALQRVNAHHSPPYDRIIDQWTLCEYLGPEEALSILAPHWDGFVTRSDLERLRATGINTLRLPVPYWIVDIAPGEPWVGQERIQAALNRTLGWAAELGLKVLVDLHAAPGSQNGFDNSGHWGATNWQRPDATGLPNIRRTLSVWVGICDLLKAAAGGAGVPLHAVLAGVELVNEAPCFNPAIDRDVLRAFLVEGYFTVRGALGSEHVPVYVHDCFYPHAWEDFMRGDAFQNVRLDRHEYQVFEDVKMRWPPAKHLLFACEQAFSVQRTHRVRPTVVGEWSLATMDCDPWLNGYGQGSRWEGTFPQPREALGSCDPYRSADAFSEDYMQFLREYGEKQMQAWDAGLGWVFWNFKTENGTAPHFDYLLGVERGYLPAVAGTYTNGCPPLVYREQF